MLCEVKQTSIVPDCRVWRFSTRSWWHSWATPEVRVHKAAKELSGVPSQVCHERVEWTEELKNPS